MLKRRHIRRFFGLGFNTIEA